MVETHTPQPPQYTIENTVEWQILHDAENFFAKRGEELRFDLVKRIFQWMLDTDENGWFERTTRWDGDEEDERDRPVIDFMTGRTSHFYHIQTKIGVCPSDHEISDYIKRLERDVDETRLTGEVQALHRYIRRIRKKIPEQYEVRREMVEHSINIARQSVKFRRNRMFR
jgi:hypothetical protein